MVMIEPLPEDAKMTEEVGLTTTGVLGIASVVIATDVLGASLETQTR